MATDVLLAVAAGTAALFVTVLFVEGARRPGYRPTYHTGSELELGERGWVQRANFATMGAGAVAFAVGVQRTLGTAVASALLAIFGVSMVVAGLCPPDAVRGYPPGAPSTPHADRSPRARIHEVVGGPVAFLALFGACVLLATHVDGVLQLYTACTAVTGLALTVWTAVAFQRDAAYLGLVQRALLLVYWTWIVVVSLALLGATSS